MSKEEKDEAIAQIMKFSEAPSYSKTNLKALTQAGGFTIREYLSSMNNLLDPLAQYDMKTLKLERETPNEWVLLAENKKQAGLWPANRLYFDKKTGFLKKVEAEIKEMNRTITLLEVKRIVQEKSLEESRFQMEIPTDAIVIDQTDQYLMDLEMQKKMEEEKKKGGDAR